jgi:hypothetical protein
MSKSLTATWWHNLAADLLQLYNNKFYKIVPEINHLPVQNCERV